MAGKPDNQQAADGVAAREAMKETLGLNNRRLMGRARDRRSKMIAFGYYGGKFSHLDFLLPLCLPFSPISANPSAVPPPF